MSAMMWFAASSALSAFSASSKAKTDANTQISFYNHEIQNSMNNQVLTDLEIGLTRKAGRTKENANRLKYKHMIGAQKTGFASKNIRIDSGTPVDIMLSTKVIEAKEREMIGENTDNQVFGLKIKKFNYQSQEEIARNKLRTLDANKAGNSAFMGSLLSSAGSYSAMKASAIK